MLKLRQRGFMPVGAFKQLLAQSALWVSMVNFVLIGVTAYNTTLRPFLLAWWPGVKLWHFLLVVAALVGVLMLLEYLVIYPSWLRFQNKQEYLHQNLLRRDIEQLRAEVAALRAQLQAREEEHDAHA